MAADPKLAQEGTAPICNLLGTSLQMVESTATNRRICTDFLSFARKRILTRVYVHAFLDGRDTPPASGKDYIEQLLAKMKEIGVGKIASLSGRYYAMDRDNNWDRVQKAYDSLTKGEGVKATCPVKAMEESYANDVTDEFVLPTVITNEDGTPVSVVRRTMILLSSSTSVRTVLVR